MDMYRGTSPRTPTRRLTLHEYKRQCRLEELTPPPSEADGGRRIKRKRGEMNLSIDKSPLKPALDSNAPQAPHFWSFPITPAAERHEFDDSQQLLPLQNRRSVNPYSFASIFKVWDSPRQQGNPQWCSNNAHANAPTGHIDAVSDTIPQMATVANRAQALKPHKRLPRPNEPLDDDDGGFLSLRRVAALSSDSFTATDTSSLSLSRFPEPPYNHVDSLSSEHNAHQQTPRTPSPTILHMRGVSFDMVNPHRSLALQNIETPHDRDSDSPDYFHLKRHPSDASTAGCFDMAPSEPIETQIRPEDGRSRATPTPPRPIFPNFQSAYNSIRRGQERIPSMHDLPLPPIPLPTRVSPSEFENPRPIESVILPPTSPSISRPESTVPSFMRRFSRAFHRKTKSSEGDLKHNSPGLYSEKGMKRSESFHATASTNHKTGQGGNVGSGLPRSARSEGNMTIHYYDIDSIFDSSLFQRDSASIDHCQHQQTLPYSGDGWSHSHNAEAAATKETFDSMPHALLPMKKYSVSKTDTTPDGQPDSTIGSILEQYQHMHEEPETARDSAINMAFMDSMRKLRPTNSGLSQFEFGFDAERDRHVEMTDNINDRTYASIRHATVRALGKSPGAGPTKSLPPTPTAQLAPRRQTFLERSFSNHSAESMSWVSYGDTRHLLAASQELEPAIEFGRDTSQGNLSQNEFDSPDSSPVLVRSLTPTLAEFPPTPPEEASETPRNPSIHETAMMTRGSILDLQVEKDIKHLSSVSTMSGLSNISGSIFILNNTGMPSEEDFGRIQDGDETSAFLGSMHDSSDKHLSQQTALNFNRFDLPQIAAFHAESIKPGIWRLSRTERQNLISDHDNESQGSPAHDQLHVGKGVNYIEEDHDGGNDRDWETVAESRNGISGHKTDNSSIADWTSLNTLSSLRNIDIHPGDSRYQHGYRFHSQQNSNGPILLPSYDFRAGASFPNRNALLSPEPILYTTYNHPTPLPVHQHPFSNSPPQIGSGSPPNRPSIKTFRFGSYVQETRPGLPAFFWPGANLSVVHETTAEGSVGDAKYNKRHQNGSGAFYPITPDNLNTVKSSSSGGLSINFGPSSSLEVEHSVPDRAFREDVQSETPGPCRVLNSSVIRILRDGDPRMPSTPLHPENSFAMVSPLSPLANVTGTPNGTGMRWLGSSLVGTSSPVCPNSSSLFYNEHTGLTTPTSSPPCMAKHAPAKEELRSPLMPYNERCRNKNSKPAKVAQSHRESLYSSPRVRSYVESQSGLLELQLSKQLKPAATPTPSQSSPFMNRTYSHKGIGNQLRQPLLPMVEKDPLTILRETPRARSLRVTRVPSSLATSTRSKKQFLSWMFLLVAILFPPLTLLYGLSKLDVAIFSFTKGEIEHFGQRQKKVALFGIPLSSGIWALILMLAAFH